MSPLILYLLVFIAGIYIGISYVSISPFFFWVCISILATSVICLFYIRSKRILLDYRPCRLVALMVTFLFAFCYANVRNSNVEEIKNCEQPLGSLIAENIQSDIISTLSSEGIEVQNVALLEAILLGNREHLSESQVEAFKKTGTMHILVVSGMHVALIFLAIRLFFSLFELNSKRWISVLSIVLIWIYAALTGLAPSVCRATLMISFVVLIPLFNARIDSRDAVFLSLFALLLYDPSLISSYSLWLSYTAVYALFQSSRVISKIVRNIPSRIGKYSLEICLASCVCQAATAPIILSFNDQFPTFFALNNLIIVPLLTPLLIISCLAIVTPHFISQYLAAAANTLLSMMDEYTQYAQSWHHATIHLAGYTTAEIVVLTFCVILLFSIIGNWNTKYRNICGWLFSFSLMAYVILTIGLDIECRNVGDKLIVWRKYDKTNITLYSNHSLTHFLEDAQEEYSLKECEKIRRELRASDYTISQRETSISITTGETTIQITPNGIVDINGEITDIQLMNDKRIDIPLDYSQ